MGQDVVKSIRVNGKLVQTGRSVLPWLDVVRLAGWMGDTSRVSVTTEQPDGTLGVLPLERGEDVEVRNGLKLTVTVTVRGVETGRV